MAIAQAKTLMDDLLEYIESNTTPEQIIAFTPSDTVQNRVSELLQFNRERKLMHEEERELDGYEQFDNTVSIMKAKARLKLAGQ